MKKIVYLFFVIGLLFSCSEEETTALEAIEDETCEACLEDITLGGVAQKGPFLNGSSVSLFELNTSYVQTGNAFNTQISNNLGDFQFTNISLATPFAVLRADGFYYNEVCGEGSNSQITLNGIAQIRQGGENINLNVLTHLEKPRVEYLLQNTSLTFNEAKAQAQEEVLAIFNISPPADLDASETFNIANNTEGDAILIAVSSILQGYRTESQFSSLMANITTDITEDGVLDSQSLGRDLYSHAILLNTNAISENIETRFEALGITLSVPVFDTYITNFINNTTFPQDGNVVDYPEQGLYGINILNFEVTTIQGGGAQVSLAASVPSDCIPLTIKIAKVSGPYDGFCFGYLLGTETNWAIGIFNQTNNSQTFTSSGEDSDLAMVFNPGIYLIEYFESDSETPLRTKEITVQ